MSRSPDAAAARVVAFDLMDTVVVDPFTTEIPKLLPRPLNELAGQYDETAWPAFERGQIDEQRFLRRLYPSSPAPGLPTAERVRQVTLTSYRFMSGMPDLLARLRGQGLRLWIFSNYPVWFEVVRQQLSLDRFFDGYVVSYTTGVCKPEPAAFEAFCARVGCEPAACTLVDDQPANVAGARSWGMRAIAFTGVATLEAEIAMAV